MARYAVSGITVVTGTGVADAIAEIWNPSTTKRIKLIELHIVKQVVTGVNDLILRRSTAKGTSGSTVTPSSVNEMEQIAAPPSAFTLELAAFSVQPTLAAGPMHAAVVPASIGAAWIWVFGEANPLEIPSAAGIVLTQGTAIATPVSRITAVVED